MLNFNAYSLYKSPSSNNSYLVFIIKTYVSVYLCVFHYLRINSLLYMFSHPLLPAHLSITPLYSCLCIINIFIKYFSNEDPSYIAKTLTLKTLKTLTNTIELQIIIPPKMRNSKYRWFKNRHTCEKACEVLRILNRRYLQ